MNKDYPRIQTLNEKITLRRDDQGRIPLADGMLLSMGSDTYKLRFVCFTWLFGSVVKTGYRAHCTYYTRLVCNVGQ